MCRTATLRRLWVFVGIVAILTGCETGGEGTSGGPDGGCLCDLAGDVPEPMDEQSVPEDGDRTTPDGEQCSPEEICFADFPCTDDSGCEDEKTLVLYRTVSCEEVCGTPCCEGAQCWVDRRETCEGDLVCHETNVGSEDAPEIWAECISPDDIPPCGDAEVRESYGACTAATTQTDCEFNGGTWVPIGGDLEPSCQCPTGQGGCPCTRPSDCLSTCIGEFADNEMWDCEGVTGHCSPVSATLGCHCWFDEDGTSTGLCAD